MKTAFETRFFPLWVIFKPAEDIPGTWVAHCLDLDVITSGTSLPHALGMILEAAAMTIEEDLNSGRNPLERRAPPEFWQEMERIITGGRPTSLKEVLSGKERWKALALQVLLRFDRAHQVEAQEFQNPVAEPEELALAD